MPVVRAVLVAGGCALVAVGCSDQSRIDPGAAVVVSGTARAPDGAPLGGEPVRLGSGVSAGEGAFAVLTLGLACTTGICTGNVHDTTTGADGSYRFDLEGRATQSSFGEALSQLVSVSGAPEGSQVSGPTTSARFRVQVEDVRLPVLELVDPRLSVDGGADVVARWSTPRPGPYELTFEEAQPAPVWRVPTAEGAAAVDPRVLEDTSGRVVVAGGSSARIEGSDVEIHWRSPGVAYVAGAGPPASRGRPCRFVDAAGAGAPTTGGCPVTDGDLTSSPPTSGSCITPAAAVQAPGAPPAPPPPCSRPVAVVVDLGRAVPADLVVVRGCEGGCAVDVSADGRSFTAAGAVSDGFGTLGLAGQPITSVRVGLGSGTALREISVWGGRPATAALLSVNEPPADLRRAFGAAGDDDEDVPFALGVVAVVLAVAVLAALGFTAGTRPGTSRS